MSRLWHTHQDSTIDPRKAFDVQLMYFPHDVTPEMGGTRFVPGTHLRIVSEAAIGRYQNISGQRHVVCKAGTMLFMHMGIWHGGGLNQSERVRYMFKIRLCPTEKQVRLWDDSDLTEAHFEQRPIFWTNPTYEVDPIHKILTTSEKWFEYDTGRLEYLNRIRFWRYLLGDETFDADYWVTRVENETTTA
ncbi:MAG: phytanoyl-CoA dioxygenase family protein [Pseudomonadota bacterium]